jgi:hypothetical protein
MRFPKTILSLALACLSASALAQPLNDDPLAPIRAFVTAINADNTPAAAAAMTPSPSITDEFAPFHWEGKNAVSAWMEGDAADAKAHSVTDGLVTIGQPVHLTLVSDHAYAVVPMQYAYKQTGQPVVEKALFTASLVKQQGKWLMSSWAYALK